LVEGLGVPVAPAADAQKTPENQALMQAAEAESRQKLWRWFIAATLAVLLVETALAGRAARRATDQPVEVAS
jgi:anti-sigma-K factor RskA